MNKSEIGKLILQQFINTKSKANHIQHLKQLGFSVFSKLNPKEQDLVNDAIQDLINDGLISIDNRAGGECLVLTEKGFDFIYPIDNDKEVQRIKSLVMQKFAQQQSRPNDIIQVKWIEMYLLPELNPKQQLLINAAIAELITNGLILFEKRSAMDCLVLTEKGYETLY